MFRFDYLIIEEHCVWEKEDPGINGLYRLAFNEFEYGMLPTSTDYPSGPDYIDYWVCLMLKAVKYLRQNDYVALHDIETNPSIWLEFKRSGENLDCALVVAPYDKNEHLADDYEFSLIPLQSVTETEWRTTISYKHFEDEIIKKTVEFINFMEGFHADYMNTTYVVEIQSLLHEFGYLEKCPPPYQPPEPIYKEYRRHPIREFLLRNGYIVGCLILVALSLIFQLIWVF